MIARHQVKRIVLVISRPVEIYFQKNWWKYSLFFQLKKVKFAIDKSPKFVRHLGWRKV